MGGVVQGRFGKRPHCPTYQAQASEYLQPPSRCCDTGRHLATEKFWSDGSSKEVRGWSWVTDKRQKTATNHPCTRNWRNFANNLFFDRKMDSCALEWKEKYKETKAIILFSEQFLIDTIFWVSEFNSSLYKRKDRAELKSNLPTCQQEILFVTNSLQLWLFLAINKLSWFFG